MKQRGSLEGQVHHCLVACAMTPPVLGRYLIALCFAAALVVFYSMVLCLCFACATCAPLNCCCSGGLCFAACSCTTTISTRKVHLLGSLTALTSSKQYGVSINSICRICSIGSVCSACSICRGQHECIGGRGSAKRSRG